MKTWNTPEMLELSITYTEHDGDCCKPNGNVGNGNRNKNNTNQCECGHSKTFAFCNECLTGMKEESVNTFVNDNLS